MNERVITTAFNLGFTQGRKDKVSGAMCAKPYNLPKVALNAWEDGWFEGFADDEHANTPSLWVKLVAWVVN